MTEHKPTPKPSHNTNSEMLEIIRGLLSVLRRNPDQQELPPVEIAEINRSYDSLIALMIALDPKPIQQVVSKNLQEKESKHGDSPRI